MDKVIYFSKNLRTYLFAFQLRQEDLAERLGITSQAVGLWIKENRPPKGPTMMLLSSFMSLPAEDLQFRDLTYRIIRMSDYTSSVADPEDVTYAENALVTRYRSHIQKMQNQLNKMVIDGENVLNSH